MKSETTREIVILLSEYQKLLRDRSMLQALHDAGVGNWEGYALACEIDDVTSIEQYSDLNSDG